MKCLCIFMHIRVKTNSQEQLKIAQQNQQKASKVSAQYGYDKKPGKKQLRLMALHIL